MQLAFMERASLLLDFVTHFLESFLASIDTSKSVGGRRATSKVSQTTSNADLEDMEAICLALVLTIFDSQPPCRSTLLASCLSWLFDESTQSKTLSRRRRFAVRCIDQICCQFAPALFSHMSSVHDWSYFCMYIIVDLICFDLGCYTCITYQYPPL